MKKLDKKAWRKNLNRAASSFHANAAFHHEVARRLVARLDFMKITPQRVLDCGARTGYSSALLAKRYPKAQLVCSDASHALLRQHKRAWFKKNSRVCTDSESLAFAANSFDLIFSNGALSWTHDPAGVFQEFFRLLKPNGLLLFTTLGPDSLKELRASFAAFHQHQRVHEFIDMHDLGDELMRAGFLDPVMDMEYLSLHFSSVERLLLDLKQTGASNVRVDRARGLLGRQQWQAISSYYAQHYQLPSGVMPATMEIVYGHAWKPAQLTSAAGEVAIPLSTIRRQSS